MPHVLHPPRTPTVFEICHQIPGRVRLRVPALLEDVTLATRLDGALRTLEHVQAVRVNSICASVVIIHRAKWTPTADHLAAVLLPMCPSPMKQSFNSVAIGLPTSSLPCRRAAIRNPFTQPTSPHSAGRPLHSGCMLCQLKLKAMRWLIADVWQCWRQQFTQRLKMKELFTKKLSIQQLFTKLPQLN
ncbi:HMA2 domain-containing protein [Thiospirillum jenense]|uniref:Uncharacterized protein n=1 Tax=Thiospirillum jenense TaxID=1653858 RepID=A0A839HQU6_9GAMM|nr:hypothetical protein [Thiospirillum jenense]MBB1127382.1 hypothetical protein [Thiospirillum jenense]